MATHAHSTRTPLLRRPASGSLLSLEDTPRNASFLLGQGLGRQSGPVTQAIRAMRAAEPLPPADAAIEAIREGLIRYFVEEDSPDRQRVRELRRRIADRIEADLALLDALDGDPDVEPSLGAPEPIITSGWGRDRCQHSDQAHWAAGGTDEREDDAGDNREEENEHGGDIQDEPHDPQPDDVLKRMHGWDPRVADGARKARREAEAMRARKDRETRV